jgi:restriction system protein
MGYGGSIKEAGEAIGRQGDERRDDVIKEDVWDLDVLEELIL